MRALWGCAAAVTLLVSAAPSAPAGVTEPQLPNLVPLLFPDELVIGDADGQYGQSDAEQVLRFTVATANRGDHRLDLLGTPGVEDLRLRARQCIGWTFTSFLASKCGGRVDVGWMVWHPEHAHWHFDDFALYELRRLAGDRPDMSDEGLVVDGGKVSFCLQDSHREGEGTIDDPSSWFPSVETIISITCPGVHQGISSGWWDVYDYRLWGQQIRIGDAPDGNYALVVTVNPEGQLVETTDLDNMAFLEIELAEGGKQVRVVP